MYLTIYVYTLYSTNSKPYLLGLVGGTAAKAEPRFTRSAMPLQKSNVSVVKYDHSPKSFSSFSRASQIRVLLNPSPVFGFVSADNTLQLYQEMLAGKKERLGRGNIRDVFLVDYHGRKLVLKTLREDFVATATRTKKMHRWEAAALDAVRG